MNQEFFKHIVDGYNNPIVFVDTQHVIRYMNKAALKRYEKRGGAGLIGTSVFDCHREESNKKILDVLELLRDGEDEKQVTVSKDNFNIYMCVVRDGEGQVVGYYERFEKIL
jgi:transcriptional regulator with PAS, ATPase and Fis domain